MRDNRLKRKYQLGGQASSDENAGEEMVQKLSKATGYSRDKIISKLNEISSSNDENRKTKFIKAASNVLKNPSRENINNFKNNFDKFADGGKMQYFICKHAHGGNVDCGCGGTVVKGYTGIPGGVPDNPSKVVIVPKPPKGNKRVDGITGTRSQTTRGNNIVQTLSKEMPDGTTSYTELEITPDQDSTFTTWNTRYGENDNFNKYVTPTAYKQLPWYKKIMGTYMAPQHWIDAFKSNFVESNQEGGTIVEQEPNKPIIERVTGQQGMDYYNQHSEDRLPQKPYDRHIYTLDLPSHAYNPDYANPGQYEVNIAPYTSYSNLYKDLRDQYGEDWFSIGQAVKRRMHKCGGKVVKEQGGEEIPDTGTISQGKSRSKLGKVIDDNPKARHFVEGAKRFVKSPVFKLPAVGLAAYGGWKLGGVVSSITGGSEIPNLANATFAYLSQFKPKALLEHVDSTKNASDIFWLVNRNSALDKFLSGDKNKNNE